MVKKGDSFRQKNWDIQLKGRPDPDPAGVRRIQAENRLLVNRLDEVTANFDAFRRKSHLATATLLTLLRVKESKESELNAQIAELKQTVGDLKAKLLDIQLQLWAAQVKE